MARPRKPVELLKAEGKSHRTKAELKERERQEVKVKFVNVQPPDYLPAKLKDEFNEIARKLLALKIMTELDEDCLARYVLSKQQYLQYTSLLTKAMKNESIALMERYSKLQDKAFTQCRQCASDLGLTIASRCKLVVPETTEIPKQNKFIEKFGS